MGTGVHSRLILEQLSKHPLGGKLLSSLRAGWSESLGKQRGGERAVAIRARKSGMDEAGSSTEWAEDRSWSRRTAELGDIERSDGGDRKRLAVGGTWRRCCGHNSL